ncbi:hypothetical protein [Bradyrhizobium sp. Gha]|uniref:hypothetical protein n=1 Tax=Bradyrhizobium sp. Gha TaxID=1855318 RepID=UPI0032DF04CB
MALSTEELIEIERLLSAGGTEVGQLSELRRRFPQLAFVRCDASDLSDMPFRQGPRFDLHLLDGSNYCAQGDPTRVGSYWPKGKIRGEYRAPSLEWCRMAEQRSERICSFRCPKSPSTPAVTRPIPGLDGMCDRVMARPFHVSPMNKWLEFIV